MAIVKLTLELNRKNVILFSTVLILLLVLGASILYIYPRNIGVNYNGIKYQAKSTDSATSVNIKIEGNLRKKLFNKGSKFYGKIIIDNITFEYTEWPLYFDKRNVGLLEYREADNMKTFGQIITSNSFKTFTLEVFKTQNGGYSWNSGDGWLISAPANNRNEAVEISNVLLKKLHAETVIK